MTETLTADDTKTFGWVKDCAIEINGNRAYYFSYSAGSIEPRRFPLKMVIAKAALQYKEDK